MVNFCKEINKENKSNVQGLTKQEVEIIKEFYNINNTRYYNCDSGDRIEVIKEQTASEKFDVVIV